MANQALSRCSSTFVLSLLLLNFLATFAHATPVNVPVGSVSDLLIQSALSSLNDNSPTGSTYRSGNLIRAQKLLRPEYVIYKLSLNLEPNCNEGSSCPREACTIDLRQNAHGVIDLESDSIQCMYLYPHTDRADTQPSTFQDGGQQLESATSGQEPEATVESFERRTSNASLQLDHEVQTVADGTERPFVAVRATDRNYCAGCPYELNPSLPGLAAYNEQVLQSMDDTGRSEFKHRVVSIVRVTRAVPPGSNVVLYELLLEIGETSCPRTSVSPRADCPVSSASPIRLCLVAFEQRPWQQDSRKIVRNNCTDLPATYNELTSVSTGEALLTSDSHTSESSSVDATPAASKDISEGPQLEEKKNKARVPEGMYKEFDEFLKNIDFDAPIKIRDREPEEHTGTPVTEEIIRPKVAERARRSTRDTSEPETEKARAELVRELAQLAVDELDYIDVDNRRRVLLDILDSKTQPGDDSLHYITMRVATTNCPEGSTECSDHSRDEVKICRAQVQTRSSGRPDRVLQSQCYDEAFKRRDKRTTKHVVGAPSPVSVDDPEVVRYTHKGLRKFAMNREYEPFLVETLEATLQIVSGMKYKIKVRLGESTCPKGHRKNCVLRNDKPVKDYLITVWSQPWKDHGEPKITIEPFARSIVRRSVGMPGGVAPISTDDPEVVRYTHKGLRKYAKNRENEPFLVETLEATLQIVSGMKYKIKVRLGESTCPKGHRKNCVLRNDKPVKDYLITVWSQPWKDHGEPKITIAPFAGSIVRRSVGMPGGVTPISTDDPKIRAYAQQGLTKYAETFGGDNEPYLVNIVESSQQVVSGILYKIRVRLGESTCPKGTKENCQLKANGQTNDYLISVWSQPWRDHGNPEITIKLYSEDKTVSKRSLRGQNYSQKMLQIAKEIADERASERPVIERDYPLEELRKHPDSSIESNARKERYATGRSLKGQNYTQTMLQIAKELADERAFVKFINDHERTYKSEDERAYRFEVFRKNMKKIQELRTNEQGTAIYGATIFADLTPEEFRSRHLGLRPDLKSDNDVPLANAKIPDIELPTEFDWRHRNVVTEVKNQGACGSCWAFSVTGNIESLYAIKHKKLYSLSEQELVDCDKWDSGCEGGLPDNAYRAIEQMGGLELETDYPYDGADEKCHFDKSKVRVSVVSGLNITSNETQMAQWLVQNGPMSIGINANAMQFYMGGISHPYKFLCNGDNLDHGVLIVGYGIHSYPIFKKKMPYWIIKNSWGPRWGEQGYYRVYRGDGTCGLNRMVTSAVIV